MDHLTLTLTRDEVDTVAMLLFAEQKRAQKRAAEHRRAENPAYFVERAAAAGLYQTRRKFDNALTEALERGG